MRGWVFIGSAFENSSCSTVYCRACGALAAVGGREGNSSEVFTAFADCSACALRVSDYRGPRILSVLTPHASSMMLLHSHTVYELKE